MFVIDVSVACTVHQEDKFRPFQPHFLENTGCIFRRDHDVILVQFSHVFTQNQQSFLIETPGLL